MKELIGKTIKSIEEPKTMEISYKVEDDNFNDMSVRDDNIIITFTDGSILKLASWDYEGYASGIHKQIIIK